MDDEGGDAADEGDEGVVIKQQIWEAAKEEIREQMYEIPMSSTVLSFDKVRIWTAESNVMKAVVTYLDSCKDTIADEKAAAESKL